MPRDDRSSDDRRLMRAADRLDIPRELRRTIVRRRAYDADAFGRMSERIARFLGTGQFLVYMTATILFWVGWNIFAPEHLRWDQYPFIFLTLALSLQASYAAPLILLAQNRQEARDRVQYERDRDVDARSRADMEFLAREMAALRMSVGEVATRDFLRSELRSLLAELEHKDREDDRV
ncbi:putative membrane protein [Kribbella voronezhensis]|uniref:Putative membrane protein n=1 Tax=Kribbella voronezhensis TaxID=2512212 RepID=A0A4R7TH49_9ACTN|nr:DUF1003 domain-containing protein [Kribbella voronezhensis]TDU91574.1 putative membrane protein [Kribbella voronezhensis]